MLTFYMVLFVNLQRLAEYMHIGGAAVAGLEIIVGTGGWIFACFRGGCDFTQPQEVVVVRIKKKYGVYALVFMNFVISLVKHG